MAVRLAESFRVGMLAINDELAQLAQLRGQFDFVFPCFNS
jgi:hypothetical protein